MIWKNIEIFNAEELTHFADGSVSWVRIPRAASECMEKPNGKAMAEGVTGVELRFVLKGDSAKIVMSSMEDESSINTFHIYRGGLQGGWTDHELNCYIPPQPKEFTFKQPAEAASQQKIHELTGLDWDARVIRVIFDRGQVKLHDVIGEVAPPTPEQTPKKTLLCYGSSITHGSNSIDTSHTWASVLAYNLNMDLRNLGFAGSCAMEPEIVDYIAALGEQGKWQAANLELYQFLMNLDTMVASVDESTVLIVKADEYPFNILTQYSQHMTVEGNATVINDLSYILGQLNSKDRQALIDAVSALIDEASKTEG
jgi:hypothetical protein